MLYTTKTVKLDLEPKPYGPEQLKSIREKLNASQSLLAMFLGVSVKTLRSWEQGSRPIPGIACRFLEDIIAYPEIWKQRIKIRG